MKYQIQNSEHDIFTTNNNNFTFVQATLYFKKEHFKTCIPVAVTTMLVMYTLNNSISAKLPPTSYVKLIDIWLLFGLILPFIIIILLIVIEHMPERTTRILSVQSGKSKTETFQEPVDFVSLFAKLYLPLIEILFVMGYCTIAYVLY